MNILNTAAMWIAKAAEGNPIVAIFVTMLFYLMFDCVEASVEMILYGERFPHWGDVLLIGCFMFLSARTVVACAELNA